MGVDPGFAVPATETAGPAWVSAVPADADAVSFWVRM